ncbi:hypothetical protein [Microcoleus sp. CAWBG58]|uniref:hypothetical protein n=1 Tax=Microcoleus sp. CAWBG58 TaxID=2841651 RepID=UPI0025D62C3F|nr:hypothetical protein [Microcoleus sp. CAWBG58]
MMVNYTTETEKAWYKSPAIVAAVGVSAIALAAFIYPELASQPIVHYRADDNSLSADRYTLQRQTHCQLSSQHYKPGDTAVSIPFADRAVVTKTISITNSLTLMGECQHNGRSITNKQPGTSLVALLERSQSAIQQQHQTNKNPGILTIVANDFEPRQGERAIDFSRVKTLVDDIEKQGVVISFIIPQGQLYENLTNELSSKESVCVLDESKDEDAVRRSMTPCIDAAFTKARKMTTKSN